MPARHLVIMAKQPVAGNVKTRLARQIGTAQALRVYRTILSQTIRNLGHDRRWQTHLSVSPDTSLSQTIWPQHLCLIRQGRGGLGQRMQHIFDQMPQGPVIIIGSDIPDIHPNDIDQAFKALGNHDMVFGPANDGGYWLVGAKRLTRTPSIFDNVRWSSHYALGDTVRNLKDYSYALVQQRGDLDTIDDYRKWLSA